MRYYEVSKSISILQRLILYYKRKVIIASSQLAIKVNGDNCIKNFTKTEWNQFYPNIILCGYIYIAKIRKIYMYCIIVTKFEE